MDYLKVLNDVNNVDNKNKTKTKQKSYDAINEVIIFYFILYNEPFLKTSVPVRIYPGDPFWDPSGSLGTGNPR
jgi:hypothetical protein